MRLTKTQTYSLAIGLVALALALTAGGFLLAKSGGQHLGTTAKPGTKSPAGKESTGSVETSWTVETSATIASTSSAEAVEPPPVQQTQPSYKRYAYVLTVGGPSQNRFVVLDFFDILTEDAARKYAQSHNMQPPSNGILYVNETVDAERVPLSTTVRVVYKTGGVESLQTHDATVDQLTSWTNGDPNAMPNAMTNMWEITVTTGIVTKIEMVVIAD